MSTVDNVNMLMLPMNAITENIYYISEDGENQRLIIGALVKRPNVWRVSKVQDIHPVGIKMLTYKQVQFDPHTDYIDWENKEMFADYYSSQITPIEDVDTNTSRLNVDIHTTNIKLKVGGSFKTFTTTVHDFDGIDITDRYSTSIFVWKCFIDGDDITDSGLVTFTNNNLKHNQTRIKFADNRQYLGKKILVTCTVDGTIVGKKELELVI